MIFCEILCGIPEKTCHRYISMGRISKYRYEYRWTNIDLSDIGIIDMLWYLEWCPIVFRGYPCNFKVIRTEKSPIWVKLLGRSQLANRERETEREIRREIRRGEGDRETDRGRDTDTDRHIQIKIQIKIQTQIKIQIQIRSVIKNRLFNETSNAPTYANRPQLQALL